MDIILSLHAYFGSNFGFHYPTELVYYIVGLYQKLIQLNIRCGISHNFLLSNNKIYSWGENQYGQLAHKQNQTIPQEVKFDFVDVACGEHFSVGKTNTGEIYIVGHIQLETYKIPTKIDLNNVKKISCGEDHCLILANESIYILGTGNNKLLPLKLDLESVVEIACGHEYSIALDSNCIVYVWGNNTFGQLGLGHTIDQLLPQKLDFINCIMIACGSKHSLLLTTMGEVYSCGWNGSGQLGLGDNYPRYLFQKIKLENIRTVHGKGAHSMCLSLENELYAWGINECGELGLGHLLNQALPQKVKLNGVRQIDSGYSYAIAVASACRTYDSRSTFENKIYVWGLNDCGQLGLADGKNHDTPQRLYLEKKIDK